MTETLSDILNAYKAATLASMASFNGLAAKDQKGKAALLRLLVEKFGSRVHVLQAYHELTPAEREVVDILLRHKGQASAFSLQLQLVAKKLVEPSDNKRPPAFNSQPDYRLPNPHTFDQVMAKLQARGLVFGVPTPDPYSGSLALDFSLAQAYVIPHAVRVHLPEPPPLPDWIPLKMPDPERVLDGSARTFQRDMFFYWSYVRSKPVQLTAKGLILKRHLSALNETLLLREKIDTGSGEGDFPRLVFLRRMLSGIKAISETGSSLVAQPDPAFFSKPPEERIKFCYEQYTTGRTINELDAYPSLTVAPNAEPLFPTPDPVIEARKTVVSYLRPSVCWMSITGLIEHVREVNYEFLFSRSFRREEYRAYYYGFPAHPYSAYTNPLGWNFSDVTGDTQGWENVEEGFIKEILLGPLYWMGLINLGFSQQGKSEPDVFCLTSIGIWLLAGGNPPEINQSGGRVILQPNFQLTAFDPISDEVLLNLERFAERVSSDRAIELRLTQASVYAAQQQGWDADRIQAYLGDVTGSLVPDNVVRTLQDWQMLYERITVFPKVTLVHAANPQDLDALSQEKELKNWLADRPAPALARLPERNMVPRLARTLVEHAWVPLISKGEKAPTQSVEIKEDGCLHFTVTSPDLYLHGHLAPFADPDGPDGYRVTAASVQRAIRSGMTAPGILEDLKRVARNEIPLSLEKRILAWSGHYGQAKLEEAVLLQVQSPQILQELLQDPELGPLLRALDGARVQSMAYVRPQDLARLRRLLDERGIRQD